MGDLTKNKHTDTASSEGFRGVQKGEDLTEEERGSTEASTFIQVSLLWFVVLTSTKRGSKLDG